MFSLKKKKIHIKSKRKKLNKKIIIKSISFPTISKFTQSRKPIKTIKSFNTYIRRLEGEINIPIINGLSNRRRRRRRIIKKKLFKRNKIHKKKKKMGSKKTSLKSNIISIIPVSKSSLKKTKSDEIENHRRVNIKESFLKFERLKKIESKSENQLYMLNRPNSKLKRGKTFSNLFFLNKSKRKGGFNNKSGIVTKDPELKKLLGFLETNNFIVDMNDIHIQSVIGQGRFGTIHKGIRTYYKGQDLIAIKKFDLRKSDKEKIRIIKQIIKESKIMNEEPKSHKNVLKFYGLYFDTDFGYLILEYCEMGDLVNFIERRKKKKKKRNNDLKKFRLYHNNNNNNNNNRWNKVKKKMKFSFMSINIKTKFYLLIQIAEGMRFLHENKGIIHRDLKPQNIFVSQGYVIKIADFGQSITKERIYRSGKKKLNNKTTLYGTINYIAPESLYTQCWKELSDIYSFALLAYYILTESHPYFNEMNLIYKNIKKSFNSVDRYNRYINKLVAHFHNKYETSKKSPFKNLHFPDMTLLKNISQFINFRLIQFRMDHTLSFIDLITGCLDLDINCRPQSFEYIKKQLQYFHSIF